MGIDIGASAVKVAVLRVAYRKTTLEALASASVAEAGGVVEAIRAASAEALAGKPADGIAVAIEGVRSVVHTLSLPASAQKQLDEVLPFELEAALPVDMAESTFDYRVRSSKAGFDTAEAAAQVSVLAMVARTEDVRARIELVKGALGQEPERVGAGALTLANLIPSTSGARRRRDRRHRRHRAAKHRDPGRRQRRAGLRAGGVARDRRAELGHGAEDRARAPLDDRRVPRHRRDPPDARLPLRRWRRLRRRAPRRSSRPISGSRSRSSRRPRSSSPGSRPERVEQLPLFAKAFALALGLNGRAPGMDLRRGALSYERGFAWVREKIPVLAGLGAVIVVSFLFSAWAQLYASNKDVTTLEAALEIVTAEVFAEQTTSAARAQELLLQQSGGADDDPMPRVDAFDVMVKLSEDISPSTTHDVEELDVQKQHATVHGIVGTIPEAQSIKASLENERCFQDVNISRFNQQPGTDRQKYVLDIDLHCPGDSGGKKPKKASSSSAPSSSGGTE